MQNIVKLAVTFFVIIDCTKSSPQCGLYGMPPCSFLPAPPGSTPSCASPGKTYCEHVPHYPAHVIKHLIHKLGYEFNGFIVDETGEDFNSVGYRNTGGVSHYYIPPPVYGPPSTNTLFSPSEGYKYGPPKTVHSSSYNTGGYSDEYPEPIYIPRPSNQGYHGHSSSSGTHQGYQKGGYNYFPPSSAQSSFSPLDNFKRFIRDLSADTAKVYEAAGISLEGGGAADAQQTFIDKITPENKSRKKRQSPGRNTLCETSSTFITPQAALSSKGNWMYVVNQVEATRQLVKTETCISSVCSGICQLPNGYNARCEQKYVQKRLVALEGTGQRLYTDTFWFPSCCVCTIANN